MQDPQIGICKMTSDTSDKVHFRKNIWNSKKDYQRTGEIMQKCKGWLL